MPEPWFELPAVSVGGWLLTIVSVLWLMLTGRLIPRSTHEERVNDYKQQVAEWRQKAEADGARADLYAANHEKLLKGIQTSNALIRSIPGVSERDVP